MLPQDGITVLCDLTAVRATAAKCLHFAVSGINRINDRHVLNLCERCLPGLCAQTATVLQGNEQLSAARVGSRAREGQHALAEGDGLVRVVGDLVGPLRLQVGGGSKAELDEEIGDNSKEGDIIEEASIDHRQKA